MIYPEKRLLFTIREAAHACGISRATLLRIEECGFLKPFHTDPKTGYRYYDAQNIAQIGQYQLLQELGLSRNEIKDIYYQNINMEEFLDKQHQKIVRLQRMVSELEMRTTRTSNNKYSFVELPELTCYCKTEKNLTLEGIETFAYITHQNSIKDGYQMRGNEPLFIYITPGSSTASKQKKQEFEATVCIPVVSSDSSDSNLQTFTKCPAFSLTGYGNYSSLFSMFQNFRAEIAARELTPTGQARIIAHVATYVGAHISPNNFCFELVIPIQSK